MRGPRPRAVALMIRGGSSPAGEGHRDRWVYHLGPDADPRGSPTTSPPRGTYPTLAFLFVASRLVVHGCIPKPRSTP